MPARKRSREQAENDELMGAGGASDGRRTSKKSGQKSTKGRSVKGGSTKGKTAKKRPKKGPIGSAGVHFVPDPSDAVDTETRFVQPYEATKSYICPGCNRDIPNGMGHLVAVPGSAPDLRRHWHRGCWTNRKTRR